MTSGKQIVIFLMTTTRKIMKILVSLLFIIFIYSVLLPCRFLGIKILSFIFNSIFRTSMVENMREIEKCKAEFQNVEVPMDVLP